MEQILKDQQRTDYLNQLGYQVLRFWDHEVLQELDSVLESIRIHLMNDPHPNPVRMARGGSVRRPTAACPSPPLPGRERGEEERSRRVSSRDCPAGGYPDPMG